MNRELMEILAESKSRDLIELPILDLLIHGEWPGFDKAVKQVKYLSRPKETIPMGLKWLENTGKVTIRGPAEAAGSIVLTPKGRDWHSKRLAWWKKARV
jgi:hypothetical protein